MALAQSSTIHHISLPAQQAASCSAIGTVAVCAVLRRLRGAGICELHHLEVPQATIDSDLLLSREILHDAGKERLLEEVGRIPIRLATKLKRT